MTHANTKKHRRPVEAIEQRARRSKECEQRVRKALTKLTKTGVPFTVENVYQLAGVGKTFIYDKRHPELTKTVLAARDASQVAATTRAERNVDEQTASWRERALNAEALSKKLRADIKDRDARIAELTGQLYDPDGTHLADENARLRDLLVTLNKNLHEAQLESHTLRRSLDGARANVQRERERNVTILFPDTLTINDYEPNRIRCSSWGRAPCTTRSARRDGADGRRSCRAAPTRPGRRCAVESDDD